jgi:hypothetical protein
MLAGKTPEEVRYALSEEAAAAAQAQNPGIANLPKIPKSKQQVGYILTRLLTSATLMHTQVGKASMSTQ